ncbi:MAG: AraC family transcriptional regulator ligand-binding domain-containing protein [Saprospiraceae bacterium]
MHYIAINLYRKLIDHALHEGLTAEDLKQLSIPVEPVQNLQAVPADVFFELHEVLDQALGPGFSVRVGQQMKMDDYGVLGLSWKTCSKAGEIFERCERYFKLLSNTYVFKVKKEGASSHIYLFREAYRRGVELSNEATFSAAVVVLQAMTETGIAPLGVSFKHRAPTDLTDYRHAFKCPVRFNQSHNLITYRTTDLETPTSKADSGINTFLLERVEEETRGMVVSATKIASDVEGLIRDALPSGIPSVNQIGTHMGMSSRTLTRRLSENGIAFRKLVKQTQENISKELLRNSDQTVSEIAFQTGFSEQSAFSRAFKRWTGQSPQEYRIAR